MDPARLELRLKEVEELVKVRKERLVKAEEKLAKLSKMVSTKPTSTEMPHTKES